MKNINGIGFCTIISVSIPSIVRADVPKGTADIFFRKVKFWKGDPPPVFVSTYPYEFIPLPSTKKIGCGSVDAPPHVQPF